VSDEACEECGAIHGPGNTNTLCPRSSNYRGLGHSAWKNRSRWRTGTKNPHTIYLDDEPVGFILDPALAKRIVERLECFPIVETKP
jgi:hypothetical protein